MKDAQAVFERTRNGIRSQLVSFDRISSMNNDDESDPDNFEEGGELMKNQSIIAIYDMFLAQEMALYKTLNSLRQQNHRFIGFFWAPVENEREIIQMICENDQA